MARSAALLLLALVAAPSALAARTLMAAPTYSLVVFGDALSDNGNTLRTGGAPNPGIYSKGRYTNGPAWVDYYNASFPAGSTSLTLLDYAYGGATACLNTYVATTFPYIKTLGLQVADFVVNYTRKGNTLIPAGSTRVDLIWIGANDVNLALQGNYADATFISTLVGCTVASALALVTAGGAKTVGIMPIAPLQTVPSLTPQQRPLVAGLIASINAAMAISVAEAQAALIANPNPVTAGAKIVAIPETGLLAARLQTRSGTCFQLATPYLAQTITPADVTICPNPALYNFYDGFQPTTVMHKWAATVLLPPILQSLGFP